MKFLFALLAGGVAGTHDPQFILRTMQLDKAKVSKETALDAMSEYVDQQRQNEHCYRADVLSASSSGEQTTLTVYEVWSGHDSAKKSLHDEKWRNAYNKFRDGVDKLEVVQGSDVKLPAPPGPGVTAATGLGQRTEAKRPKYSKPHAVLCHRGATAEATGRAMEAELLAEKQGIARLGANVVLEAKQHPNFLRGETMASTGQDKNGDLNQQFFYFMITMTSEEGANLVHDFTSFKDAKDYHCSTYEVINPEEAEEKPEAADPATPLPEMNPAEMAKILKFIVNAPRSSTWFTTMTNAVAYLKADAGSNEKNAVDINRDFWCTLSGELSAQIPECMRQTDTKQAAFVAAAKPAPLANAPAAAKDDSSDTSSSSSSSSD